MQFWLVLITFGLEFHLMLLRLSQFVDREIWPPGHI